MTAGRVISALLILCAISLTALWIRSFWLMDDIGVFYVTRQRPGSRYDLRFFSVLGSTRFSISIMDDAAGTGDLALTLDSDLLTPPGFHFFANLSEEPRQYSYGKWWQEKDYFAFPGFGLAHHGWTDRRDVAQGWLVTTQPTTTHTAYGYSIWFPHPISILALLAWPIQRWRINRRLQKRLSEGLCTQCGYDIRATPDRCPECGYQSIVQI